MKELINIQSKLVCNKNQFNNFAKYKYRSCEDILEAVKPLLAENNCTLTITDDIITVSDRVYVKATATLKNDSGEMEQVTAFAREEWEKKGQDSSQLTGSASSYARKYALNGLFCIDDNKDSDFTNDQKDDDEDKDKKKKGTVEKKREASPAAKETVVPADVLNEIRVSVTRDEVLKVYMAHPELKGNPTFEGACKKKVDEIKSKMS